MVIELVHRNHRRIAVSRVILRLSLCHHTVITSIVVMVRLQASVLLLWLLALLALLVLLSMMMLGMIVLCELQ